jgi:hypothetical protein
VRHAYSRRLEDLPQQPVDLLCRHRPERDAADEVDVADPVEHVVHAVETGVALQQEAVDDLVLLVRPPADERLHEERVLAHHEPAVRPQAPGAGQGDQELARIALLVLDPELGQRRRQHLRRSAHDIHAVACSSAACRRANSAAASS